MANKNGHGGKREGAGRPKGSLNETNALLRETKKAFQERVASIADQLFQAQSMLALGERNLYIVRKDKDGKQMKAEMVDDPNVVLKYLQGDYDDSDDYYYIATKSPDNQAATSLLDRAYGKARQEMDITSGGESLATETVDRATHDEFLAFMKSKYGRPQAKADK